MQDTTVALEAPEGLRQQPIPPDLVVPAYHPRTLPPEIMALASEQAVIERIAQKGQLVDPRKRDPQLRPDGYVKTHITLSDIAFDPLHERAAFIFSASCGCLGGQGGMVLYQHKGKRWRLVSIVNHWMG